MRFFREILTVLAGLVALLLGAALAGPYFVDWNKHKPEIVKRLEQATGAKIVVAGDIDLKLLPSPRLRLGKVRVAGQKPASPQLAVEALNLELGLTALLRGQIRLIEATLVRPRIQVFMQEDGGVVLPDFPAAGPWQIAFEHVALQDARITINRAGGLPPLQVSGLVLEASGQSLDGPFRGNGSFSLAGDAITYSFNTGTTDRGSIRAKFVAQSAQLAMRGVFDGTLSYGAGGGHVAKPAFTGTAALSGQLILPGGTEQKWRASGPLQVTAAGAQSEAFDLRAGDEERAVSATGSLEAVFRDAAKPDGAHVKLALAVQQINADALLGGEGGPGQAMSILADGFQQLAGQKRFVPVFPVPVDLEIATAAFTIGRETLSKVSLNARLEPNKPAAVTFVAGAPGSTSLALRGKLETGAAALFRGRVKFATRDMRRLEQWLARGLPQAGRIAGAAPYRSFRLEATADISKAGIAARDVRIETGRSRFDGALIYTKASGAERSRVHIDLISPSLDIDGLGDFSAPANALGDMDFYVAFDARAVRLAQLGKGVVDAGKISLRMERKAGALRLPHLRITNLGGANVTAIGSLVDDNGRAEISVDAKNLVQISQLLVRVAPGPWSHALAARAPALSPAKLNISLRGTKAAVAKKREASDAHRLRLKSLEVAGELNGTKLRVQSAPDGKTIGASGSLRLEAEDSAILLRQLGMQAISLSGRGKSIVEASWRPTGTAARNAKGKARQPAVELTARIAGTDFSFSGDAKRVLPQPDIRGKLAISSKDAAPLLQLLAYALPNASAKAPLDVSGDFAWRGGRLSVGSVQGHLLGSKLTGHAVLSPRKVDQDISRYFFNGAMRFERLGLRGLTALVFGPDQGGKGIWRSSKFQSAAGDFPPGELEIEAGRFDLPGGGSGQGARFTMRLSPGLLALDNIAMRAGQTALSGSMIFRNDKATSAVSGSLAFRTPTIGLHGISGAANGKIDFAATGNSELELISGLAGKGLARVKNLTVAGADPAAMQRVLKATDAERLELTESGVRAALRKNFSNAPLSFDAKTFALTIAGGAARLETEPAKALSGDVDGTLSATFDIRALKGLAKLDFVTRARPKDWNGALPAVSLERVLRPQDSKSADAGTRIVAAAFVNGVSARAIVREVARMEALEFDIRERAYFNRQVKSAQFIAHRKEEISAYRVEQARLAEEARKRAEEEARQRAREEARRKAEEEKARKIAERKRKIEEARQRVLNERRKAKEARIRAQAERKARIAARRAAIAQAAEKKKADKIEAAKQEAARQEAARQEAARIAAAKVEAASLEAAKVEAAKAEAAKIEAAKAEAIRKEAARKSAANNALAFNIPQGKPATAKSGDLAAESRMAEFVRTFDGSSCFYSRMINSSNSKPAIEGFGAAIESFVKLDGDFKTKFGVEASINVNQIRKGQCALLNLAAGLSRLSASSPRIKLVKEKISNGQELSGEAGQLAQHTYLFLAFPDGAIVNIPNSKRGNQETLTFSTQVRVPEIKQLESVFVVAVTSTTEIPLLEKLKSAGVIRQQGITALRGEIVSRGLNAALGIKYFTVQ